MFTIEHKSEVDVAHVVDAFRIPVAPVAFNDGSGWYLRGPWMRGESSIVESFEGFLRETDPGARVREELPAGQFFRALLTLL